MKLGISGKTAVNMEESQEAYSYQKYPIARVYFFVIHFENFVLAMLNFYLLSGSKFVQLLRRC